MVKADASATLWIISRRGLGKVRHLDTSFLWLQEAHAERNIRFDRLQAESNNADLMTKHLAQARMMMLVEALHLIKNGERQKPASKMR